jgi:site-specific recombinase XerD
MIDKGVIKSNPFAKIKASKTEKRQIEYPSIQEAAALMEEFFKNLRVELRSRPKWKPHP